MKALPAFLFWAFSLPSLIYSQGVLAPLPQSCWPKSPLFFADSTLIQDKITKELHRFQKKG